jgi:glycosyltransferase involved in cell wall biosynthesis
MSTRRRMTICYLPGRESGYPRNRVLIRGMRAAGLVVLDCSSPRSSCLRYIAACLCFLRQKHDADIVFVGFLGHFLVPLVRLCTRKPIVFDAFISLYQTLAVDRRTISPNGIAAYLARLIDRSACQLADVIILDTNAHIGFFVNTFHLDRGKFHRVFVGSDDSVMYPRAQRPRTRFVVHFHGEYQALHGAEYIVEAARLLPEVFFQMIGAGRCLADCKERARRYNVANISFIAPMSYELLAEYIAQADVCLGIFGRTQKAELVIPHKVFEALACGKPLITADSAAARELLTDRENALLCAAGSPTSLAAAIHELQVDARLRRTIAENGHRVFSERCTPEAIGSILCERVKAGAA